MVKVFRGIIIFYSAVINIISGAFLSGLLTEVFWVQGAAQNGLDSNTANMLNPELVRL